MFNEAEEEEGEERLDGEKDNDKELLELASLKGKSIYERKATESLYSEELEFHQYRKKKRESMDKKSKHLLLFSSVDQLNFSNINKQDKAKAWAVLYHFKSKSHDSLIYEEFETIAMRNSIGKSKGHEFFSKFYSKLNLLGQA